MLDVLRRHLVEVPFSCRMGLCHTCMLQCLDGDVPGEAQKDIKTSLRAQNYFLACQYIPKNDIEVALPERQEVFISTRLVDKHQLSPTVWRLRLETAVPIYYHAGQFINIRNESGWMRSYSLASLPSEDALLELQVKRMPEGRMSNWIADKLLPGMHLEIEGPNGHCYYTAEKPEAPILLVGTGTGLAPLVGILRDALHSGHIGPLHLYHGCRTCDEIYLHDYLAELAGKYKQFHYTACVTGEPAGDGFSQGRAADLSLQTHASLAGWQVYICGAPSMVKSVQKAAFLAGANMPDIYTDPFETQDLRQQPRD